MPSIPPSYKKLRSELPFTSVSMGYAEIQLFKFEDLAAMQQGFGIVPEDQESGWDEAWLVIGIDETADPIFVDTDDDDLPVYTAPHGEGEWVPQLIAFSFKNFADILMRLRQLARNRESPEAFERNPLLDHERESLLGYIHRNNPDLTMVFWRVLLEPRD